MWEMLTKDPRALFLAIVVHLILIGVLMFSLDWTPKAPPAGQPKSEVIKAVALDDSKVQAEIERLEAAEQRQEKEAAERLKILEDKAREAEEARKREQQQLTELKKKQEAEKQRQAEIERKKAAEQQRLAELKKQQEAIERKKHEEEKRLAELEAKRKIEEAEREAAEEAKRKAEAEAKRKAEEEARRKAEAEAKRKAEEEAKRKAEAEAKRRAEAEAKRKAEGEAKQKAAEQALQEQLAAERAQLDAARERANQGVVAEYTAAIKQKVQRNWIQPPASGSGLSCTVQVRLIPGGDVASVQIVRSSGDPTFDRSVEAAVYRAAPLPLPPDTVLFDRFRELQFIFSPT
jgi:colicin import membrane protein